MLRYTFLVLVLAGCAFSISQAQSTTTTPGRAAIGRDDATEPSQEPRQEMLKEMELKRAENSHKQNIERAKESAQLSAQLRDANAQQKALNAAELKKLGRMEKLARQLRSEAGGGDDEEPLKDPPKDLPATLTRIAELAAEVCKNVEKTPRHVVSASMIAQTNELVELIRLARGFAP